MGQPKEPRRRVQNEIEPLGVAEEKPQQGHSRQALRKPSVTVYLSLAAAQMYWLTRPNREGKLFAKYRRRSAVVMKQL